MPILRAQVAIPAVSTVSEDTVTNTWHFTTTDTTEGTLTLLKAALVDFYEDMDAYKSDLQLWASARVKIYNMSDPEPRVPIDDVGLTLTSAPSGTSLPHEVAAVLSFHGEYVSGFSQARRRGRIYFGPLNNTSFNDASGVMNATFCGILNAAGGALLAASDSASDWAWVVYSPTGETSYPVVGGWVDNAPDIQRRRGFKSTARVTFG
jgi:hypothetical protein